MNCFRRFIFTITAVSLTLGAAAQTNWPSPEVAQMYQQARNYLSNGNMRQAIVTYQQAIQLAPDVMVLRRDLAQAYILTGNFKDADKQLEPVLKSSDADEQCFQLAASSFATQQESKKARNTISKGLERYPHSGLLYHELGKEYDDANDNENALKSWLDGIEADPAYHVNYYEAARTYMITNKVIWAILYGEMFVNMEQQTPRSNETRKMLLGAYKRLFYTPVKGDLPTFGKDKKETVRSFEDAVSDIYMKLSPVVSDGVTTENLIMLRTRFLMEWANTYAAQYPFTLFTFQDNLVREGSFDVYNQWLLGKAENQQQYEAWNKFHEGESSTFDNWIKQHRMQPVAADFYNSKKVKDLFQKNKN
ncbi:tetratricopeptide repeat protein [Chitinophagaceae bacterium MMS25-I14]